MSVSPVDDSTRDIRFPPPFRCRQEFDTHVKSLVTKQLEPPKRADDEFSSLRSEVSVISNQLYSAGGTVCWKAGVVVGVGVCGILMCCVLNAGIVVGKAYLRACQSCAAGLLRHGAMGRSARWDVVQCGVMWWGTLLSPPVDTPTPVYFVLGEMPA